MVKCASCGRFGYFKVGICGLCRRSSCKDCGKVYMSRYQGQKRCPYCETKRARDRVELPYSHIHQVIA